MTAQQPAQGQRGAAARAMPPNRLGRVVAAARHVAAVAPDEGSQQGAVRVNREEQGPCGGPGPGRGRQGVAGAPCTHARPLPGNRR